MGGSAGRIARPERFDQAVDGDDVARLEGEHGEQRARLLPTEGDEPSVSLGLDGTEEAYLGLWAACPAPSIHLLSPECSGQRTISRDPPDFHPVLSRS
jgi:hypothetical protein